MLENILTFLNENSDALGLVFGSGIMLVVLGSFYRLSLWIVHEIRKKKTLSEDNFSFKIITPNSNVAKEILGGNDTNFLTDRNIPYQQRVSNRSIRRDIEKILYQNHWVLLTGKTGLGKTREAINVADSLCTEGWTVLYLTRDRWLSPPPRLPAGVPERKLLFILDDLNRKMYASRAEQSPKATESLVQSFTSPLQDRLFETLKIFETLCGKQEILVIATARDETHKEFYDEISEWDKLEFDKYEAFWGRFAIYKLSEPEDNAEINLLQELTKRAEINANFSDFHTIAKRNDGTFANIVENFRHLSLQNGTLSVETFRETLKGTWKDRYKEAISKSFFAKYFYDAVELARYVGIQLSFSNVFSLATIIAGKDYKRIHFFRNKRTLQSLITTQNILNPRDGQIEAKGYKIDFNKYLPLIYLQVSQEYYSLNYSAWQRFLAINWSVKTTPKKLILKIKTSKLDKFNEFFFNLSNSLYRVGNAYLHYGFYDQAYFFNDRSDYFTELRIENPIKIRRSKSWWEWFQIGNTFRLEGKLDEAINAYKNSIDLNRNKYSGWNNLGIVLLETGEIDRAREAFDKAIAFSPPSAIIWYNLGYSYSVEDKFEEALKAYLKASELIPNSCLLKVRLAGTLFKIGDDEGAYEHINDAKTKIQHSDAYTRAAYEAICGNTKDAIEFLEIALDTKIVSTTWARNDSDFENIQRTNRFKKLTKSD